MFDHFIRLAGHNSSQSGVTASQHLDPAIQSQPSLLFVFTVTVPATLLKDRSDVALEINLLSLRVPRRKEQKQKDREPVLTFPVLIKCDGHVPLIVDHCREAFIASICLSLRMVRNPCSRPAWLLRVARLCFSSGSRVKL